MASRFVFSPVSRFPWYQENAVSFDWVSGFAKSQAQKSIRNLHDSARKQLNIERILEVSTKSEDILGQQLSAFNLQLRRNDNSSSLESTYQASKVFENDLQFSDLLDVDSYAAKSDLRLRTSGRLIGFRHENNVFGLVSSPNFYDYLYIRALMESGLAERLHHFQAFTDYAFSSTGKKENGKSYNCQARSLAIFLGITETYSTNSVIDELFKYASRESDLTQPTLFEF